MTRRVVRTLDLAAPPEDVWEFLTDPRHRAHAVSAVRDIDVHDDEGRAATLYVEVPVPLVDRTIPVHTEATESDRPERAAWVGRSGVVSVEATYLLERTADGTCLTTRFVVDSPVPGVEAHFERRFPEVSDEMEATLRDYLDGK